MRQGAAALVLVAALLSLLQAALGLDLAINYWLFPEALLQEQTRAHPHPGRMADVAAASFALLATSLLLVRMRRPAAARAFVLCATAGLLLVGLVLIGYLFNAESLYGAGLTAVSLPAAGGLAVLIAGTLALRPELGWIRLLVGSGALPESTRRLICVVAGAPVGLAWVGLAGERAGLYDTDFRLALLTASTVAVLVAVVLLNARRLDRAEAALRESEQRVRLLTDHLPVLVSYIDREGVFRFGNAGYEQWFGIPSAALAGRHMRAVLGEAVYEQRKPHLEAVMRGDVVRFEGPALHRTLGERACEITYVPDRDAQGAVRGFYVMVHDITERKRAEQQLRHSEARLRFALEASQLGSWELDLATDTAVRSLRHDQIFGYGDPAPEWGYEIFMGHVVPEDRAHVDAAFREALESRGTWHFQCRIRRLDGAVRWIEAHGRPDPGSIRDGRVGCLLGVVADITERKRAEQVLQEEAHTLGTLNRIGKTVAAQLDIERAVQVVTDAAAELAGAAYGAFFYSVGEGGDGTRYMLYALSGAPREAFAHFPMPRNTAVFGPTFRGEAVVRSDDITQDPRFGKNAPYHGMPPGHLPVRSYLAAPVVSRSGEVIGGLFFGHPQPGVFTERAERLVTGIASQAAIAVDNAKLYRAAQEEIASRERAEAALREANRRKDEFLATLAHELRNPLAPIRNGLQILKHSAARSDEHTGRITEMMERQMSHLVRLVDDLLDVSRITRGRIELRRERVDLTIAVVDALEASRTLIEAAQHEFAVELTAGPVYVEGDATRLSQVFANLLNNAAKYTPPGGRIALALERQAEQAIVRVRDSGIGIPPELLERIFEPFLQLEGSRDGCWRSGLGIGLTLARQIVRLHGGELEARSEGAGRGSEFIVRLPSEPPAPAEGGSAASAGQPLHREPHRRILVVDDDADAADSLVACLQAMGHHVHTAHDGPAALEAAERFAPQIVLLDIGMPGMDGYTVARHIRDTAAGRRMLLVALTGWGQAQDERRAHEAGFDQHLTKPVDLALLQGVLAGQQTDESLEGAG